jgi:diadenosine tetraphosphatase ApaH/serine/threonine PP2A family protein phosphatase
MRHVFVGDVHGMSEELRILVDKLHLVSDDTLVFVGDLVDKGPDSVGVVRFVRELSETGEAEVILVEGNHEDKHRRYRRNLSVRPKVAADQAIASPELADITGGLSIEDVAFLDSAVPFHRVPKHDLLVVHGGIPGNMAEFPDSIEETVGLTGKAKRRFSLILRTRFVTSEDGKFLTLGSESESDPYWADVYDGRFGHVVFGHEPFLDGPGKFSHATGVDTGAVFGGSLTALVIDSSGTRKFVSVPAKRSFS